MGCCAVENEPIKIVGLEEAIERLRQSGEVGAEVLRDSIRSRIYNIRNKMVQRTKNGPIYSRTGELSRSFHSKSYGNLSDIDSIGGKVWTNSPYAAIHEFGGTIEAKRAYANLPGGPFLNIPSDDNKTPAGVMRMNAREVFNAGAHIQRINGPKAKYMVLLNDKPMFWLVKSVTIKPKLEFKSTAEAEVPTLLSSINKKLAKKL